MPAEPPLDVSADVVRVARRLARAGRSAWLVGESLHALWLSAAPRALELATSATPDEVLDLLPTSVPTRPAARTVMVPTAAGPVDVVALPAGDLHAHLAHRGFTIHASAYDPLQGSWLDPHCGRDDARAGHLRAVGEAAARLAEDPLRALEAAILVAAHPLRCDDSLATALPGAARALAAARGVAVNRRLMRLLGLSRPGAGVALLRRTQIEKALMPGARADAADLIDALPCDRELRLAAWLRGVSRTKRRKLRLGRVVSARIQRLLAHHPIEQQVAPHQLADVQRLRRRLGERELQALLQLREVELELQAPEVRAAAASQLASLRSAIAALGAGDARRDQVGKLALDGQDVMRLLTCRPGRIVGLALRHLADEVALDPSCNTREALGHKLEVWRTRPDAGSTASS